MAPLDRASPIRWTDLDLRGLHTPLAIPAHARHTDRRRGDHQDTTDLFDMARRQAVLRWRGLATDTHAP